MAEFVAFAAWLCPPPPPAPAPIVDAPIVPDLPAFVEECTQDDVGARVRRLRAMLDDAYESLRTCGVLRTEPCDGEAVVGPPLLGRAVDARGAPLDGEPAPLGTRTRIESDAPLPSQRLAVKQPLWTGVRCIDALLTLGRGARVGIFGAPGAGKSTLLETIVLGTRADAVVVGLVGERGREAQRWIAARDERTTVICATSDRSAQERVRAADMVMAHARALASRGLHVLVVLDSLARYAYALREVAASSGESVGRGGYPPSVFARMAQLVERAGAFATGSITMLATVLNDGEDRDPVSEAARSLLDGHFQLSPRLAQAGRFPAIDVPASSSRTMEAVASGDHLRQAAAVRSAQACLDRSTDARSLGIEPTDAATLAAVAAEDALEALLRQGREPISYVRSLEALGQTADMLGEAHGYYV
jgi:FliI/YscN family ATPase